MQVDNSNNITRIPHVLLVILVASWGGSSALFFNGNFGHQYAGDPGISILAGFLLVTSGIVLFKLIMRVAKDKL